MALQHRRGLLPTIILTGYLLVLVDVSIVMVALPHIRDELHFSATALSWVQNAYTLTLGDMLLLGACVGDLLGRRRTFVLGIGIFTGLLSWRVGFFIHVPFGIAAMLAAPRYLPETARHRGRVDLAGALSSTLGAALPVFGIVHSADAGWGDPGSVVTLALGLALLAFFIAKQARSAQPTLPLRLFADRDRAGAYAARFLFNGALLSSFRCLR